MSTYFCAYCSSVPFVPLCLLFLCAHCSSVPTVPLCLLCLCAHCSSVPTIPLCPLFLCAYCSSMPTVPLCPLYLCAYRASVPTVPLCPLCLLVNDFFFQVVTSVRSSYTSHKPGFRPFPTRRQFASRKSIRLEIFSPVKLYDPSTPTNVSSSKILAHYAENEHFPPPIPQPLLAAASCDTVIGHGRGRGLGPRSNFVLPRVVQSTPFYEGKNSSGKKAKNSAQKRSNSQRFSCT